MEETSQNLRTESLVIYWPLAYTSAKRSVGGPVLINQNTSSSYKAQRHL